MDRVRRRNYRGEYIQSSTFSISNDLVDTVDVGTNTQPSLSLKGFSRMNEFRKENKHCDVTIVIDGSKFPCHRVVLASASTFFDDMFSSHSQLRVSEQKEVEISSVSAECFESVLEFIYCKQTDINPSNSYELLTASKFFGYDGMEDFCVEYVEQRIPENYAFETCMFAKLTNKTVLYENAVQYVAQNMSNLCTKDSCLDLSNDVLEDIIKHGSLKCSTDNVVDAIVRWKKHKRAGKKEVEKLINTVFQRKPSTSLSSSLFADLLYEKDDAKCLYVHVVDSGSISLVEWIYNQSNFEWQQNKNSIDSCTEQNVVVKDCIFTLRTLNNRTDAGDLPRIVHFTAKVNDEMYILSIPPTTVSSVFRMTAVRNILYLYNMLCVSDNETNITSMKLFPKSKDDARSQQLFAYMYDLDDWFAVPKPKYDTTNSCLASFEDQLFLIGGKNSSLHGAGYVQCYDQRSPSWTMLPEMLYDHFNGAACSYQGKLYVFGGDKSKMLEVYDRRAGRWETLKPAQNEHSHHCFVEYRDELWAIGNCTEVPVECYNLVANVWTNKQSLLEASLENLRVVDAFVY